MALGYTFHMQQTNPKYIHYYQRYCHFYASGVFIGQILYRAKGGFEKTLKMP